MMGNIGRRNFIAGTVAATAGVRAAGFARAATIAAAPVLTDQEMAGVLASLGAHFTQRASLATSNPIRVSSDGRIALSYQRSYDDKVSAIASAARAIASTHAGYTHASSTVQLVSTGQPAPDGSVQLTVQEITTLAFAQVIDPGNADMSYAAKHVVTLTRNQGAWSIQAIDFKTDYKAFIPITQLPEDVPDGTPDHPVAAPSEYAPITFEPPEEQGPQMDKLTGLPSAAMGPSIASAQAVAGYDYSAMVAYAKQYYGTGGPGYPNFSPDDCTNFVSQCLFAGGWGMTPTGRGHPSNDHYWYCYQLPYNPYNPVWPAWDNSHSWSVAQDLRNFAYLSHRAYDLSHVKSLGPGDILGFDYEPDGTLDHMEICSSNPDGDPRMVNRQIFNAYFNKPLSEIRSRYPNMRLWPQRT